MSLEAKNNSNRISVKNYKQTFLLFSSQILLIFIGLGIKYIQTNALGKEAYGVYAFFGTITGFSVLFFRLGFISSLQVLLAECKEKIAAQKLIGTGFLITLLLGISFAFYIFILSFFIDNLFEATIGNYLFYLAPFCIIFPFRAFFLSVATGTNEFQAWVNYDVLSKVFFFIILLFLWFSNTINLWYVLLFNVLTLLLAFAITFPSYKASFNTIKNDFSKIWEKNKAYGFHFYLGTISNLSTYKLDELLIVFFIDSTQLGFYTLAIVICSPMVLLSQALSNSLFKKFAQSDVIPKQVFTYNLAWLLASLLGIYILGDFLVDFIFGEDFALVKTYLVPLSFAYFFQGMYQPYNFLTAKSQGKQIRNVAFAESFVNIIGNFALIPILGVMGAIFASIFAKALHYCGKVYYYNQYLKFK